MRSLLLRASESRWLAENLPRLSFSRRAVKRFMPGEALEHALAQCAILAPQKIGTVITRLGENITALHEAEAVTTHYLDALDDIARAALPTQLSVKLTQLGLDISAGYAAACTDRITAHSARHKAPVWIDMESSRYTEVTLDVFRHTRAKHENIGVCVQAYLHRTRDDIDALLSQTTAIRLVKGAYKESAAVAIQEKKQVDENYFECANKILEAARKQTVGYAPAFATHDITLIKRITQRAHELNVRRENYEFHLLYGINTAEQQRLAREGYRVRVLISYGSAWFAWYMRRLAERPANVWFVAKSMLTRSA